MGISTKGTMPFIVQEMIMILNFCVGGGGMGVKCLQGESSGALILGL